MFRGFFIDYPSIRELVSEIARHSHNESNKAERESKIEELKSLFISDEPINGEKVAALFFPESSPDVFLSHSFKDREVVAALAGAIRKKGLSVFVDSELWGSIYDLQREVDNEFCRHTDRDSYSYEKRNRSTVHVHMILNSALHNMINQTEAFFFLGTSQSLVSHSARRAVRDQGHVMTFSPWIHSELQFSSQVTLQTPDRWSQAHQKFSLLEKSLDSRRLLVAHPAPLSHLIPLKGQEFKEWLGLSGKGTRALDDLYHIAGVQR